MVKGPYSRWQSYTGHQAAEVGGDAGAVQGQVVDQALDEIYPVHRSGEIADAGSETGVTVIEVEC